jgi:AbrB family looped-hinge helix DNA binding protein
MNLARVSATGQVTIPYEIRRALNIKEGDKLLFMRRENGDVLLNNSSLDAIEQAQAAFVGCEFSEEDILAEVMRMRYGEEPHAGNV